MTTILVTAEPPSEAETQAPTGFVSSIDTTERAVEGETVADALSETVGVQVRRFGGLGDFSTLSIRGSSPDQVRFYLDGVPMWLARNETVNLADLPLDSLDRIEVYRGTVPVAFGAGSIGGVVNLVTRPPSAEPTATVAGSYGSFETRKAVAAYSQRLRDIDLLGFVTYQGSKGDFSFHDDNGTPENPFDDQTTRRENNEFDSVDAVLKAGRSFADRLRADLVNETFYKDEGVPGIGSFQSDSASQRTFRNLSSLRLTPEGVLPPAWEGSASVFGVVQLDRFVDLGSAGRPGADLGLLQQDRHDETVLVGSSTHASWSGLAGHLVDTFAELSHERFSGRNDAAPAGAVDEPDQTRWQFSLAAEDVVDPFEGRFIVLPALRYQHLHDSANATYDVAGLPVGPGESRDHDLASPSLGTRLALVPWLSLQGNIGYYQRAPNFQELFGVQGNVRGNPRLDPEDAINRDIGLVAATQGGGQNRLRFEYSYFNNDVDDLIALVQTSPAFFTARNIGAARLRGNEFSLTAELLGCLDLAANYTHQDAENRSSIPSQRGNQLPGRPENEVYARVDVFRGPARAYYAFDFVGGNYTDQANLRRIPSRDVHTVGLTWQGPQWLTLAFEARNLTDNQISDIAGFPLPGRSFFGTVQWEL